MTVRGGRFWLTPPDLELQVIELLKDRHYYDPCPYPRGEEDALQVPWRRPWYCNPPFNRIDGGCAGFARKAVATGGPGVFVTSIPTTVVTLLQGGARFIDGRRIAWLEVDTKKPMPSPGMTGIFYLPRPELKKRQGRDPEDYIDQRASGAL
jgi:hypothetical protein